MERSLFLLRMMARNQSTVHPRPHVRPAWSLWSFCVFTEEEQRGPGRDFASQGPGTRRAS